MRCLVPFIGEILGIKAAPIDYLAEEKRRSPAIRDVADAEIAGLPGLDGKDITITNLCQERSGQVLTGEFGWGHPNRLYANLSSRRKVSR
jgi:hypothetical protein